MNLPQWKKEEGEASGKDVWAKLKTSQIKKEEADWLGIEEFLTIDPAAKFTRENVLDFVRENGVNVEEVVAGEAEGETQSQLEWDDGVVWDDPEAWE
jgi:hypothetical protein